MSIGDLETRLMGRLSAQAGAQISMASRGNPCEKAQAASFMSMLKLRLQRSHAKAVRPCFGQCCRHLRVTQQVDLTRLLGQPHRPCQVLNEQVRGPEFPFRPAHDGHDLRRDREAGGKLPWEWRA